LVNVQTLGGGKLHGKCLQRNHRENRAENALALRGVENVLGVVANGGVALLGNRNYSGSAGSDFLDVADYLWVQGVSLARLGTTTITG